MKALKKKQALAEKSVSELNPWPSYIEVIATLTLLLILL